MAGSQGREQKGTLAQTPCWEWICAALGLLLVTATISFLVHQGLTRRDDPPVIVIHPGAVSPTEGGYLVELEVRNDGGTPAAGLVVEGELQAPDQEPETSETEFDYVPHGSTQKGGLFFTKDPRAFPLELRAKGYREP